VIALAPHAEDFVAELFGITPQLRHLQERHNALAPIYALKRKFVQKKAISGVTKEKAEGQSLRQPVTSYASNLYFFYCSLPPWNLELRIFTTRTRQTPGR